MAELREIIRARIERESEGITRAVEESMAKASREQKRALALWSTTAMLLIGWVVLVAVLGLGTWHLGAKGAQQWKELRLLEAAYETENEGLALMRELLARRGIRRSVATRLDSLAREARQALAALPFTDAKAGNLLNQLLEYNLNRSR